jgi:hypothetical protein
VRKVRAEDDAELASLAERVLGSDHGAAEISAWRLWGVPDATFVAVTDRIVAVSLVHSHKGKFWISYLHTDPEWTVSDLDTAVVAASLRVLDAPVQAVVADDTSTARLLAGLGFTSQPIALPVLVVDGAEFSDFDGFAREFTKLLDDYTWTGNLDAFNDILRGGFGTPDLGWVFRWLHSESSRSALGHEATVRYLQDVLRSCHPANREHVAARIDNARRGEGPTLFDRIVEIIRHHGPGGQESEDNVILELR